MPKFVVLAAESRLLNRLRFPEAWVRDPVPLGQEILLRAGEDETAVLEWRQAVRQALANQGAEIRQFWHPSLNFTNALLRLIPLHKEYDEESFFATALSLDETVLRQALLQEVFACGRAGLELSGAELELFASDLSQRSQILGRAGLAADALWMVSCLLEEPKAAVLRLHKLYRQLRSVSDALLATRAEEAERLVRQYAEGLSQAGAQYGEFCQSCAAILPEQLFCPETKEINCLYSLFPWEVAWQPTLQVLLLGFCLPAQLAAQAECKTKERARQVELCKILADPTRYELCRLLAAEAGQSYELIARKLGVSRATLSHHVKLLRQLGLLCEHKGEPSRGQVAGSATAQGKRYWDEERFLEILAALATELCPQHRRDK